MSIVDLIALALIALTALSGFRRGLVTGVLSLIGLAAGAYVGIRFGPEVLGKSQAHWTPVIALVCAMVLAAVGQTLGVMLGRHVRRGLLVVAPLRALDNVGGFLLGAVTGLVVCWVAGAALLYIPGQTELRRYAQESAILSALNEELPPARVINALSRVDPFSVIAGPAADVDPPDAAVLESRGVNAAAFSIVRVVGDACGLGIEGSGWIAGRDLVVTNAHVVAGVDSPRVERADGRRLEADVVSFDRTNDVAVLRVSGLGGKPLALADAVDGTAGAMLGYPANGPYVETPVRVGRTVTIIGRDAYGSFPVSRVVTSVRGTLRPGNSGGPIVDAQGRAITTVFAKRVGKEGGYGVPTSFVRAALESVGPKPLHTPCADR